MLGGTLGRMEARAALIVALKSTPKDELTIPLGKMTPEGAVRAMYAIGLQQGDFRLDKEGEETLLALGPQGQDRLISPVDQVMMAERELAMAIKRGQMDEEGWVPKGFADRQPNRFQSAVMEPPIFRDKMADIPAGATEGQIREALENHVGSRIADGENPKDIHADISNLNFLQTYAPGQEEAVQKIIDQEIFPLTETVMDPESGQPVMVKDKAGNPTRIQQTKQKGFKDIQAHLEQMAERALGRKGEDTRGALHAQMVDTDSPGFADSVHQALAEDPRTQAAFIPVGELDHQQQAMIREYFLKDVDRAQDRLPKPEAGAPEPAPRIELPSDPKEAEQALDTLAKEHSGPEPKEFEEDMFGEVSKSPIWLDWNDRRQGHLDDLKKDEGLHGEAGRAEELAKLHAEVQANLQSKGVKTEDSVAPKGQDLHFESRWQSYVDAMGGLKAAQQAVQDHMANRFLGRFKGHAERIMGKGLKTSIVPIRNSNTWIKATGTHEQREEERQRRQEETDSLRKRDRGRFSEGTINDQRESLLNKKEGSEAMQGSMFNTAEYDEVAPGPKEPRHGERLTLGRTLENQIRNYMPFGAKAYAGVRGGVQMNSSAMSGRFMQNQRAVKAITRLKRMGLFMGAGSGKTSVMLGAATELHHSGKLTKAIMAVPSIVQAQFGAEGAKFIDPASGFGLHARPGESFQERMQAYRDPASHAVVVTHQALRDDTIKVLQQHRGDATPEDTVAWVKSVGPADLAKTAKTAWSAAGVDFNTLMIDEGHDALNRKGKPDSTLARIMDALGHSSEYYVPATGSPVKNDSSEAFDWLTKLDPARYPRTARDEFLRRYGTDTPMSRRSLKMELSRYFFVGKVPSGVVAHIHDVNIPTTPKQDAAIQSVDQASAKLRTGDPDIIRWANQMDGKSFEGKPESEHQAIAEGVKKAVGTFRESAISRILNTDPEGLKIAKHVEMAKEKVAAGKPVVIFAHNLAAVAAIQAAMEKAGLPSISITGKDSAKDKANKVSRYYPSAKDAKPEADVLILSDAAATGVNLQRGKVLIHHDQPMTYKGWEQRTARIDRLGQTEDVEVYNFLADHPADRAARARVKRKEVLANVFQSPEGYLDDSGIAEQLASIRARRMQTANQAEAA